MLTIRESQLKVLAESSFERWLIRHVIRCFPEHVEIVGKENLGAAIRAKQARATRYFRSETGIRTFVDVTCLFGDRFDEDPALPWAQQILTQPAMDEAARARLLYTKARTHLIRSRLQRSKEHARPN